MRMIVVGLVCFSVFACDGPTDAGEGEGEGEGEVVDVRAACAVDDDCADGFVCSAFFDDSGSGVNHCTTLCSVDDDCAVDDGFAYRCEARDSDGVAVCMRVCTDSSEQCGDHGFCLADNVCIGRDRCDVDDDCADGDVCTYDGGSVDFVGACSDGASEGALRGGEACDPNAINPPAAERCGTNFCTDHGVCGGICDRDEDCPADMGCLEFAARVADGPNVEIGLCAVFDRSGALCSESIECAPGQVCAFAGLRGGVCQVPRPEEVEDGGACSNPIRPCQSQVCIEGTCRPLCDVDAPTTCAAGDVCESIGPGDLGACR